MAEDVLRLTVTVQKQRPRTVGEIENYGALRLEDQEKIESAANDLLPKGKENKSRKRSAQDSSHLKNFIVEYAKSSRAACKGCEIILAKGEVCISKKGSDITKQFGGIDIWHHIACFVKLRDQLTFYECGDQLPGFRGLTENDKAAVKTALPEIDKRHTAGEVEVDGPPAKKKIKLMRFKEIKATKKQNKQMFKYRGALKALETEDLSHILTYNNQDDASGTERRPRTVGEIEHYGTQRLEDQEKIESAAYDLLPKGKGSKSRKRAAQDSSHLKNFIVEYAKSSRAACKGCEIILAKGEVCISKKGTDITMQFGGMDRLHIACFVKLRDQLEFYECGDQLPGFRGLTENDKAAVKTALPEIDKKHTAGEVEVDGPPPKKKIKLEKDVVTDSKEIEATKEQNKQMFKYRGALKVLETEGLSHILTYNNQDDTSGTERKLDRISDIMTYGALEACPSCKGGQLVYRDELEYQCTGDLTEWTKNVDEKPARTECQIPKNLLYKYSSLNLSKVERLTELGGKLESKLTKDITAVISTEDEVEKMSVEMKEAHIHDTRVVPATFIDACQDGKALDKMKELSISPWGSDPKTRVDSFSAKLMSSKSESQYERKSSSKVIVKVKGGYAVDPNSNLQDVAHVHKDMNGVWDATLIRTEVQSNENSFCKLQLLKSDETPQCWVFRVWGRIGTTIGGHQLEPLCCIHKAQKVFATVYETYTGNAWNERERFDKNPNLYCPVEIDYSVKAKPSKLSKAVQDLTTLLLDVDPMKEVIREFEIDLEKMPLGKLSKNQIEKARHVLSELQKTNGDIKSDDVIEASNRFYSLIPHDFGFNAPPLLDNKEIVQTKLEMLKSLEDTKVTCCLLNETTKGDDEENPIDAYYRKLNSDITVIDRDSDEFHTILNYVKNTHSSIHSNYTLDVLDVFRVKRNGDDSRFKPYEKLHNQKLLWHGSKLSNFPGILSQGLRIAPPEAPATGCMFGKGVYFADMVSKSANYSLPSLRDTNPIGLLLACQVALGEMYERTRKEYIEKLPPGKHSCKGVGAMCPDPDGSLITPDGVEIPCGKPKSVLGKSKTALDHNEYIVYDAARVKAKYLVKIKFKTTKKHRS